MHLRTRWHSDTQNKNNKSLEKENLGLLSAPQQQLPSRLRLATKVYLKSLLKQKKRSSSGKGRKEGREGERKTGREGRLKFVSLGDLNSPSTPVPLTQVTVKRTSLAERFAPVYSIASAHAYFTFTVLPVSA